jgi:hypothetical protein
MIHVLIRIHDFANASVDVEEICLKDGAAQVGSKSLTETFNVVLDQICELE